MSGAIDFHAHVRIPTYLASLVAGGATLPGYGGPAAASSVGRTGDAASDSDEALARRLDLMAEAGVERQVLSATVGPYLAEETRAREAARLINDVHARLVAEHPMAFAALAALPLPHVDTALGELARALDELGLAGVAVHCSVLGRSVADPDFEPVLAELNRRRAILFLHPAVNGLCSPLVNDWGLAPTAGTVFEDTTSALHLIVARVPERFPDVRIIVPHLGGALPMMLNRLDNQLGLSVADLPEPPSRTARRFWYDTVGHGSTAALRCAIEAFGVDRILAGTDYPVMLPFAGYHESISALADVNLDGPELERVRRGNALDLLGQRGSR